MTRARRIGLVGAAVAVAAGIWVALLMRSPVERVATSAEPPQKSRPASPSINGDWIAYSTAPHDDQRARPYEVGDCSDLPADTTCAPPEPHLSGSDVFLVRAGGRPKLVAGRGNGKTWNVCPAFSPDGTMLAFGTTSPRGRAVEVVRVSRTGRITPPKIDLDVPGTGPAPCPRWSSDGSRLAYVEGRAVVVRALDGSSRAPAGDAAIEDFVGSRAASVVAPAGDLVARFSSCAVTVSRPDGSDERDLDAPCAYALAGWSPDARKVLVMEDISGSHFRISAVSVNAPFEVEEVIGGVRVNHPRSWPGYGEVSWQRRPSAPSG